MPADDDRSERLAAALRANLARRKAQARARRAAPPEPAPPPETPEGAGSGGHPASGGSSALPSGEPEIVPDDEPG